MSQGQEADVLDRLMAQIHQRVQDLPPNSYTTKLIQGGVPKMGEKILEEAAEVVEAGEKLSADVAAQTPCEASRQHLVYEAGDLIYHLWTLLGAYGITVDDLRQELARREGTSGLEEKKNRKKPGDE